MCNLYSITTNQAAIAALFRVVNRYVGNLPAMPGVFPDYPAPVVRNAGACRRCKSSVDRPSPTSATPRHRTGAPSLAQRDDQRQSNHGRMPFGQTTMTTYPQKITFGELRESASEMC